MIRIVPPSCGVCGHDATYQMESVEVKLCHACASFAFNWLYRNDSYNNIIGADIGKGLSQQVNRKGAHYIWIQSAHDSGAFTSVWIKFDSEDTD